MIVAVDVHYGVDHATAAGVAFHAWADATAALEIVVPCKAEPAAYEPGEFYKRELPHILAILAEARDRETIDTVVIDGYVTLGAGRPGLGARLRDALGANVRIIGVAKTPFHGNDEAEAVTRGQSRRPLYVTAAGMDVTQAAELVRTMHGAHRIPTLLQRADQLSRHSADS
jgi:deoxyribonuclease V